MDLTETSPETPAPRAFAPSPSGTSDPPPRRARLRPLVLLPAWNEEAGLEATLADLRAVDHFARWGYPDVLVVDGRSVDRTVEVALRHRANVLLQTTKGKGAAVREGLAWAAQRGYGSVAVLDADATYPCDRLPVLFGLLDLGHELVVGVRRPTRPADVTPRDLVHRIGNGLLNLTAAHLAHGPILDVCSGFWGLRTAILPSLDLRSDGFEIESELFVKAMRQQVRVVQVPVDYRPRIGTAKLHAARDGVRIFLSIARHARPVPSARARRRGAGAGAPLGGRDPSVSRGVVEDLATTLLALGPPAVAVVGPSSRAAEAAELARILRPYGAGVETVRVGARASDRGERFPGAIPASPVERYLERGTGVVTLPDPGAPEVPAGSAVVELPKRAHRLVLSPALPRERGGLRASVSGGFSLGRPAGPPRAPPAPGSVAILAATLETGGSRRLETLLRANVASSQLLALPARTEPKWQVPRRVDGTESATGASWSAERP